MKKKIQNETENLKTEIIAEQDNNLFLRQNSEKNFRVVTLSDFHKQDHTKFLILPKRRADTNSVFSFGLKYAMNQENTIVKDIKNDDYFKFDYNILKNRIKNNPILREKIIKRILLNKNLKKQYALLEKPFPLLIKTSNCRAINKSEEFLLSMIMNHKFDIGDDLLMELIEIRRNKVFNFVDQEEQKNNFLRTINNQNNEDKHKKPLAQMINLIDFQSGNFRKRGKTYKSESNNNESGEENIMDFNQLEKQENENSRNKLNFNLSDRDSKNNGSVENKNDFFLISSNFDKGRISKRANLKRRKKLEDVNLSEKQEQDLIKSLEFDSQKYKYETNEAHHSNFTNLKRNQDNLLISGNSNSNFFQNNENLDNNFIDKYKNCIPEQFNQNCYSYNNNKQKTIFYTNIKSKKNSYKNLTVVQNNPLLEKNPVLLNFNKDINMNFGNNTNNIYNNVSNVFANSNNNGNMNNNVNSMEESLSKTKISMKNVSTFNSNVHLRNLSRRNEKDDSRSRIQESSLDNTDNLINFNKSGNKTVSTENDFRKFNKNAINKILNTKKNNKGSSDKPYFIPDYIRYKYPEENNKPKDLEFEKIKNYANRKNKSSQIKSRVYGPQNEININILNKFKQQTVEKYSNFSDSANNFFTFENNILGISKL